MGLFDFIMKGIGFEEGENGNTRTKTKKKTEEIIPAEKYSSFDNGLASTFSMGAGTVDISNIPNFSGIAGGKNVIIYAPKSNKDIQLLIDCMRRGEACIINLGLLQANDAERILDFFAGAAYALKGSIKRLQGDLFLLTPDGVNVMTQKN